MANAKKCDRCGKYFDKRTSIADPLNDKFNFNYISIGENKIDLCEGCLNSFVDWLKDEESHEEVFDSGEEYVETDTKCDMCKYLNECIANRNCFNAAISKDSRKHYVHSPGAECKAEEEAFEYYFGSTTYADKGGDSNE